MSHLKELSTRSLKQLAQRTFTELHACRGNSNHREQLVELMDDIVAEQQRRIQQATSRVTQ